jgi:leucyl aminopeptidase
MPSRTWSADLVVPPILELTDRLPAGVAALAVAVAPGVGGAVLSRRDRVEVEAFGADPSALAAVLAREKVGGAAGEIVSIPVGERLLIIAGIGDGGPRDLRRAAAAVARRIKPVASAAVTLGRRGNPAQLRALTEGLLLGGYSFKVTSSASAESTRSETLESVVLVIDRPDSHGEGAAAVRRGEITATATRFARDLANTPSSTKTPAWLARQATTAGSRAGVTARVLDERQLRDGGFGGIVAVGMGSASPPRLIELSYTPTGAKVAGHVVLVGKGITFDSGGLSLKPNANMIAMKTDMAAGGAVIATMSALRDLDVRVRVTGLIPAAENMPSGSAQRPSDVITQYGGTTVEVLNTDAEGRLVLADALAYADQNLDPDVIVDLATLTGAITSGLGKRHAGLFTGDETLATALLLAGAASGEGIWRMPLVDDYRDAIDSPVADLANVSSPGAKDYKGGAIVAALFLREFAGRRRWAHLDIAGVGRADADEHEISKGPTGYGVRLLLHWLGSPDPLRGLR